MRTYNKDIDYIKHSKYFNRRWYLKQNKDVKNSKMNPYRHYLIYGWKEGRNPSSNFITNFYLEQYPDIKQARINPLAHYEKYGKYEGRKINDLKN